MGDPRPNRSTYRLSDSNYDLVWRESRDHAINHNEALNQLLDEVRRSRIRRMRRRVRSTKVTANVANS